MAQAVVSVRDAVDCDQRRRCLAGVPFAISATRAGRS